MLYSEVVVTLTRKAESTIPSYPSKGVQSWGTLLLCIAAYLRKHIMSAGAVRSKRQASSAHVTDWKGAAGRGGAIRQNFGQWGCSVLFMSDRETQESG